MKRVIFLIIGIFITATACQDDFVESENELSQVEKSAKFEKIKTFNIKSHITVIPNNEAPTITCNPETIVMSGSGWVSGQESIFGKIVQEKSIYEKEYCELTMTMDGPVLYTKVNVLLHNTTNEKQFVINHHFINIATGESWGNSELTGGTGRFEGATGYTEMLNVIIDPVTGIGTWDEEGEITLILK
ncbi:hypothetical protein [uncultured Draconibacterium sp.]|uniref:hypothetical protein n=1 Tax=uncultured Draconibacterium sp. TaxID=1573823 RepID=UPI002AA8F9BF|nr:hypothetical protein [uncultured Draconibacterium sp.]